MIQTARLILSAWTEADRDSYVAMAADPEVMADYGAPFSRAEADARFDRHADAFVRDGFGKWALRRRTDNAYLGYTGVSPIWPDLPVAPGLEIGWRLRREAWGQGYAAEAARAALTHAFGITGAAEILSYTAPDNLRSQAVMQRLGLRRAKDRDFRYADAGAAIVFVADRNDWTGVRAGWAKAAADVGSDSADAAWSAFGNDKDDDLTW